MEEQFEASSNENTSEATAENANPTGVLTGTTDTSTDTNPESQALPQLYTIKVGGEEKQLSLEDLIGQAQQNQDYTKKTQILSQERKQYEVYQAKAMELQKYGWDMDSIIAELSQNKIEADATANNVDPKLWGEFQSMKDELSSFKQNQTMLQQKTSLADKPFFKEWESEVEAKAKDWNTDYQTAYTLISQQRLPEILAKHEQDLKAAKDTAIKEYLAQKTKPQGTVEGGGQSPVIEQSAPKTFADAKKNSIELLRSMMNK